MAGLGAAAANLPADLKRRINLRPLPDDHPNFTGSNPAYQSASPSTAYLSGFNPMWDGQNTFGAAAPFSWDVDNDGDGVPDSVWVDLGMPVRSTTDGRLYKPLFAILCRDLDGSLNLNAHGSLAHVDQNYISGTLYSQQAAIGLPGQYATGGPPAVRGQGLGPAEITLRPLLPSGGPIPIRNS